MNRKKRMYTLTNGFAFLLAGYFLYHSFFKNMFVWKQGINTIGYFFFFVLVVIVIHTLKAFRLFVALLGHKISLTQHICQYCKCVPISMVIPFKIGELFRAYCYGYYMGSFVQGIMIILFDRYVDTLALLSIILLAQIIYSGSVTWFVYLLFAFSLCAMVLYFVFPGMYQYWNHYFIKLPAKKRNNLVLASLASLNSKYEKLAFVIQNRFWLLYFLSVLAWILELIGALCFNWLLYKGSSLINISEYLTASLTGFGNDFLKYYILIGSVVLFLCYLLSKSLFKKRVRREKE